MPVKGGNLNIKPLTKPPLLVSVVVHDCSELDGFSVLNQEGEIIGLITYIIRDNECEIISLDSVEEGKGIGTSLVKEDKTRDSFDRQ